MPFFTENVRLHFYTVDVLCDSVYWSYRYNNPRKCDISNELLRINKKFIASSSNNIFYIQIHHFTQQTTLNQLLYYTIQYLEPNTKSEGGGNQPLGSRCHNK